MEITRPQKLYMYVDESGQDTKGQLFVVAATIMRAEEQERLRQFLERVERAVGKDKKWTKAKRHQRQGYITQVLRAPALHERLFYATFTQTTAYLPCVLATIAGAVTQFSQGHAHSITICIDGLQQGVRHHVATALRQRQIRVEKVRGVDERHDALMRLADALAGFTRHAFQGNPALVPLFEEAERQGRLQRIRA